MVTRVTHFYAKLFMADFEARFVYIYQKAPVLDSVHRRYLLRLETWGNKYLHRVQLDLVLVTFSNAFD